ncbi:MAG: hypothetical protein RB292_00055 [Patescibacteria group bacterium]|jgi:hypothetical protein|nr:hypothetical protein [Patescibacteria group bacterium]
MDLNSIKEQDKQADIDLDKEYGEVFFHWKFFEFAKHQRNEGWYFWAGLVVVLLLVYSIVAADLLFGFIVILVTMILILFNRTNSEIDFRITEDGILINRKLYQYKDLKNFYIIYNPPEVKTLYFEPKSILSPRIPVALEDQNPVKIRELLKKYLEEDLEREDEPVSDQTSRMFKL